MMLMNTYLMITLLMALMMLIVPLSISIFMKKWLEKNSSFECGMNLKSVPRKPFSLQFFLLMILFIIFDIEISLIMAIPIISPWSTMMIMFMILFMLILTTGIMYEWTNGALSWKN